MTGKERPMRRRAKPAKAKVEAELPVARKSRTKEGSRDRQSEKRLAEALEQQAATAEILRVMSQSLSDLPSILTSVAESACRLCAAYDAIVHQLDGDVLRIVAHHGPIRVLLLPCLHLRAAPYPSGFRCTASAFLDHQVLGTKMPAARKFAVSRWR
jgi:hypothetical protein